ncbi:MAG: hypothetical protein Q8K70_08455 [Bacteroidota bacterium]|nr:hypothetical protein [Bacteroidota bacterium]
MKKTTLYIILFFAFTNIKAQKRSSISEYVSSPYEFKGISRFNRLIFENIVQINKDYYAIAITRSYDVNSYVVIRTATPHNSDFVLFKLDAKMNVKSMEKLPVEVMEKDLESIDIKKLGDNLCAFYYFNNRKHFKQYLFAQLINPKTLKPLGKMFKIAETPITKKQKNVSPIFNIVLSPDSKQILITNDRTIAPRKKREKKAASVQKNHKVNFWIYNQNLELLNFVKDVDFGKGNTEFLDVAFDNKGNIGFIGFEQKDSKGKIKKSAKNTEYQLVGSSIILKIINTSGEESVIRIAEKLSFTSARIVYNPNTNNIAIVGLLYSPGGSNGIYTEQINLETGELINENEIKFSKELIKSVDKIARTAKRSEPKTERKQKRQDKKDRKRDAVLNKLDYIQNLCRLGECYYNDSNELIVVAQQYYWYSVTTTTTDAKGHRTTTTTYYYVYDDIITFKLDNQAELDNFGIVPHHNVLVNYQVYKDYFALYNSEDLYIYSNYNIGKVTINNKASTLKEIKNKKSFSARRSYNNIFIYDNKNVFLANITKKKLTFGMLSI